MKELWTIRIDGEGDIAEMKGVYADFDDAAHDFEVLAEEYGCYIFCNLNPNRKFYRAVYNSVGFMIILEKVQYIK